jgi:1-acyl-sn-glycerol-3-phosphate acyltransferase
MSELPRCIPQPARFLAWLVVGQVKVVGQIPAGGVLLCSNHVSYRDVFLFGLINPGARLLVHPLVFTFFRSWATKKGFVEVSIDSAVALLRRGDPVAICPTGLVEATGQAQLPFKTGAVRIAQQAGVPVVPVFFHYGNYPGRWVERFSITVQNFLLFGLWPCYRRGVTIFIGAPVQVDGDIKERTKELKAKVEALKPRA